MNDNFVEIINYHSSRVEINKRSKIFCLITKLYSTLIITSFKDKTDFLEFKATMTISIQN